MNSTEWSKFNVVRYYSTTKLKAFFFVGNSKYVLWKENLPLNGIFNYVWLQSNFMIWNQRTHLMTIKSYLFSSKSKSISEPTHSQLPFQILFTFFFLWIRSTNLPCYEKSYSENKFSTDYEFEGISVNRVSEMEKKWTKERSNSKERVNMWVKKG